MKRLFSLSIPLITAILTPVIACLAVAGIVATILYELTIGLVEAISHPGATARAVRKNCSEAWSDFKEAVTDRAVWPALLCVVMLGVAWWPIADGWTSHNWIQFLFGLGVAWLAVDKLRRLLAEQGEGK